jgi:hypothetical protein
MVADEPDYGHDLLDEIVLHYAANYSDGDLPSRRLAVVSPSLGFRQLGFDFSAILGLDIDNGFAPFDSSG